MATHPKTSYFPPPYFFTGSWQSQSFQRMIFISTDITFGKTKQTSFSIPLAQATLYKQTGISGFYACTLMVISPNIFL